MAMLTFLRIGKEIYDETEVYLIEHLIHRRQTVFMRVLSKFVSVLNRWVSKVLQRFEMDDLL
jgi:hypothetical protein